MPSSGVHLMVAQKVRPHGSDLFFTGSIAPDAVDGRYEKDKSHFRDVEDRHGALVALAEKTTGDFAEGVLLHLYADWKWDISILQEFIEKSDASWFATYRYENGLASNYAFQKAKWLKPVFDKIAEVNPNDYGKIPGASPEKIKEYITKTYKWHTENITAPSSAFPPDVIEKFTSQCAEEYLLWRKER
ncbi:MAG: hypothetical protein FWB80_04545 [Defluviitaleaceae bacterium]|nr:hypothetical protein [Defluviitaleaceae bacterium]